MFLDLEVNDLVEYSPVGNSLYQWSKRTVGIITKIEMMRFDKDAWITI